MVERSGQHSFFVSVALAEESAKPESPPVAPAGFVLQMKMAFPIIEHRAYRPCRLYTVGLSQMRWRIRLAVQDAGLSRR